MTMEMLWGWLRAEQKVVQRLWVQKNEFLLVDVKQKARLSVHC